MMKIVIALIAIVAVTAVPVNQVPEAKTEVAPAQPVETTPVVENAPAVGNTPVAENAPVVENTPVVVENTPVVVENTPVVVENTPVVVENTPVVVENTPAVDNAPTVESTQPAAAPVEQQPADLEQRKKPDQVEATTDSADLEQRGRRGGGGRREATTEPAAETNAQVAAPTEASTQEAMKQVVSLVSQLASPLGQNEQAALQDIIATGSEILMQAERKARVLTESEQFQNLVQTGSVVGLFGIKEDGSVDPKVAADQMTDLLSKMATEENPLTDDEKQVLHDMISGFAGAFAPSQETTSNLQQDLEQVFSTVSGVMRATKLDEALGTTNLLDMFTDSKQQFDSKLLTELTETFLNVMEKQFNESQ